MAKLPRTRRVAYAVPLQHGLSAIRWGSRRRSRQVRGTRRRNYTRAVARGRSRDDALAEFQGRGGKLTVDELQRLVSIAAFGRKEIEFKFGGVQVREPETVHYIDFDDRPRVKFEFIDNASRPLAGVQAAIDELSATARITAPADIDIAISSASVSIGGES